MIVKHIFSIVLILRDARQILGIINLRCQDLLQLLGLTENFPPWLRNLINLRARIREAVLDSASIHRLATINIALMVPVIKLLYEMLATISGTIISMATNCIAIIIMFYNRKYKCVGVSSTILLAFE